MTNSITNSPDHKNHPLYPLLCDCIAASGGGSTSQILVKAFQIKGWSHDFLGWKNGKSIEELSWKDESVLNSLINAIK